MTIDLAKHLNAAQLQAVQAVDGPVLVIAGAGSGKTRTIVFRLAHLVARGVPPRSILLLTFTRKAAQEMLHRAALLSGLENGGPGMRHVTGGTFHSFAHGVLRRHPPEGYGADFTILDRPDAEGMLKDARVRLGLGKGDRSFPKSATVAELLSKARNKEIDLAEVLQREAFHLLGYADDLRRMAEAYAADKRRHCLMDYDDLLFELEAQLRARPELLAVLRERYGHIMVDEYQDTNLVQARLVQLLAGERGNVMAVGDDAQSIYAFRGADVRNILSFPEAFPNARIIKLEQNYRSTQPILDLTNRILAQSTAQFRKELFSDRREGDRPELIRPLSDLTQARMAAGKVTELLRTYPPGQVAVLFRAGYQSYHLEVELAKLGLRFRKYGGLRYAEASHVKDVLAYVRLTLNPSDLPAWQRVLGQIKGVGPRTAARIYEAILAGDAAFVAAQGRKSPEVKDLLDLLDGLRRETLAPTALLERVLAHYTPRMEELYPDDYPRRQAGLEELLQMSAAYAEVDAFLADLSLENPESDADRDGEELLTLSTIHSAKGLEWKAVLIIDLVEERFPSRHALAKAEDFEEERRLLYVACTRAKDYLGLFVPSTLYRRGAEVTEPAAPSPYIREIDSVFYDELREGYAGGLLRRTPAGPAAGACAPAPAAPVSSPPRPPAGDLCYCTHKIFGRGKIVERLDQGKCRVHFPGFGLKVILADYLTMEA